MNTITPDALLSLVTAALERTCFLITDPSTAERCASRGEPLSFNARIRHSGPTNGWVSVHASEGFVRELASSLLGVEPDQVEPGVEGRDAIRELANILGGSVVTAVGGEVSEYRLGLPEEHGGSPSGCVRCDLETPSGALAVCWLPDRPAKAA